MHLQHQGESMITAKAAIFDVDGTLIDTIKRFHIVLNQILKKHGRKPIEFQEFLRRYIGDTLDDAIVPPETPGREQVLHEFWLEFLRRYRAIDVPDDRLIPGVKEVLKNISDSGVPIAIATSCIVPADQLKEELSSYGLGEFARIVITGLDVAEDLKKGHHFSKVELLERAAWGLGVDPRDCVVVGDYCNDIRDGRKIGAKTVAVLTGLMKRDFLSKFKPDAIIESVRGLQKVVKFEAPNTSV